MNTNMLTRSQRVLLTNLNVNNNFILYEYNRESPIKESDVQVVSTVLKAMVMVKQIIKHI